jgi:CubicO group peptidase (beta-lactamase class C family)
VDLNSFLKAEVDAKTFTAYAYSVINDGDVVETGCGGTTGVEREAVDEHTLFDLASVTKPTVTTTSMGQLISESRLALETKISEILPYFEVRDKAGLTVGCLLNHTSGLPAWMPLYESASNLEEAIRVIASTPLEYATGQREVYSDLGFITLGYAIEALENRRIDAVARDRVFSPLGMLHTGYTPDPAKAKIVLTERYSSRKWGPGLVHDENCYFLGGITGHAGLFSCIRDLERFVQHLIKRNRRVFPDVLIKMSLDYSNASIGGEHSYGWLINTKPENSFGRYFSKRSIGHTGYTGTGFWIDLEKRFATILLTNRVFYGRQSLRIQLVRRLFNDAAVQTWLNPGPEST